jgi:hypothetical protein
MFAQRNGYFRILLWAQSHHRCSRSRHCQHPTYWTPSETCKAGSCWQGVILYAYSCIVVPNHKCHILQCSNLSCLNEFLSFCGSYLSSRRVASRDDMQLFMFDTFRCVEHMYNQHTKKEEHMNVSAIHLMCRLKLYDPIRCRWPNLGSVLLLVYTGASGVLRICTYDE